MEILLAIGMMILDFLMTTFVFWLLTLLLPFLGLPLAFSWGKAIVVWLITKLLKLIFK